MASVVASSRLAPAAGFSGRVALPLRAPARRVAVVLQALKVPEGVTPPPQQPSVPAPKFGWVDNAERLNSRAAMIGFFALLLVEAIAGRGLLEMMGANVGNGLPFEL